MVKLEQHAFQVREQTGNMNGNNFLVYGVTNINGITITGKEPSKDLSKYLRLRPKHFAYNPYRINVGSIGLANENQDGIVSPAYVVFATKPKLDPDYLFKYLKSQEGHNQINFYGNRGSVRQSLRFNDLCKIEIPLPPLPEQRRIVARIEELTAKIDEAQELRREAVEETEALLGVSIEDIFNQDTFTKMKIEDILQDIRYGTSAKASDNIDGIPIIGMGNIQNGQLDLSALKYLHISETELSKLRLKYGDIIVNRTNSAELVGKCAVFEEEGEYIFASYLIRLRINKNRAIPRLIALYINSPIGRKYMFETRKQTTGQANVNSQKIKAMPIGLPEISQQRHILIYLESLQSRINNLKRLQLETQSELDALTPSMLAKGFRGEL